MSALQAHPATCHPAGGRHAKLRCVLPHGGQFASLADEAAHEANTGKSRAELVAAMGEVTKGLARFAHIPKAPAVHPLSTNEGPPS